MSKQQETYTAFFYGTLMAPQVLHRVIHGTPTPPSQQIWQLTHRPALLRGYQRHKVRHADYPAIVPAPSAYTVRGTLVTGLTATDIRRLDIFEGSDYSRIKVSVRVLKIDTGTSGTGQGMEGIGDLSINADDSAAVQLGESVEAEVYVWIAGRDALEAEEWDFEDFVRRKMGRWIGGNSAERDSGFDDVDRAVAEGGFGTDPTGGRGVDGDITRALEGDGKELVGSAV